MIFPMRRSAWRDGSQREPFHLQPFNFVVPTSAKKKTPVVSDRRPALST